MVRLTHSLIFCAILLLLVSGQEKRNIMADLVEKLPKPPPAISPKDEPIILFNGKDLSGFTTWLVDTRRQDPRKVFSVQDNLIRISGDGFGYLATEKRYSNYELLAEFKWGQKNFRGREHNARDSGIFLHANGPDGNSADGNGAYKAAIECQIMEGAVGDLLKIRGSWIEKVEHRGHIISFEIADRPRWTANVSAERDADGYRWWRKDGEELKDEAPASRLNWKHKDPQWKDVLNFRGKQDIDKPDQWNRIHCVCVGNAITIIVNDQVVNQIRDARAAGQILLQCEGSEIFFRRLELHPLPVLK